MTEFFLAGVSTYGIWLIGITTLLSCLAVPVPASLVMLTAGGFIASGELSVWGVVPFALIGAVAGDQIGYFIGREGGTVVVARLAKHPKRGRLVESATSYLRRRGPMAVFLSRWLVSPLGPYVNFASGASDLRWHRFSPASIAGEVVWVALYITLGFLFADRIVEIGNLLGNASGGLAAGTVTILMGLGLRHSLKSGRLGKRRKASDQN